MPTTPFQPAIDAGDVYTDAEKNFLDETPPNLFPENHESNWGFKRKVFSDVVQDAIDQLDVIYKERFADTTVDFIDEWEEQMGVPVNQAAFDMSVRRAIIQSRLKKGVYTRAKRDEIVREFVKAIAGGEPLQLTPDGLALSTGGLPLFNEPADADTLFRVYDNPENYSYEVWIRSDIYPSVKSAALSRELTHFTPSGISFTMDGSRANILDYDRTVLHDGPSAYWKLPALTSATSFNPVLTATGTPTTVAALALNTQSANALNFNGTTQFLSNSLTNELINRTRGFAIEGWFKPSAVTGATRTLMHRTTWRVFIDTNAVLNFEITVNGSTTNILAGPKLTAGTIYHIIAQFTGTRLQLFVNGTLYEYVIPVSGGVLIDASLASLEFARGPGGTNFYAGDMDELAYYSHVLSTARAIAHNNTGRNIA